MSARLALDWDNQPFQIDTVANYNEWHYFYEYVRKVLYETSNVPEDQNKQFIRHFRHSHANGGTYSITTPCPENRPTKSGKETYHLIIDEVYLHLYDTGVGILSFHLDNRNSAKSTPEDILLINQYGRRVFPPFYLISPELVGTQAAFDLTFLDERNDNLQPHGKEIAHEIKLSFQKNGQTVSYAETWADLRDQLQKTASAVALLSDNEYPTKSDIPDFAPAAFCQPFLKEFTDPTKAKDKTRKYCLQSVLDDRMFTVCWYGDDKTANDFGPTWGNNLDGDLKDRYLSYDWWYQYVFVDGNKKTIDHPALQHELIGKASYLRWAQRGTWYGVTDYSFVMLTSSLPTLKKFDAEFLVTHLQSIYYKLVELTLVQRATVQRFSDEVTTISRLDLPANASQEEVEELASASNDLYKRYIRFVNGLYFREVTAQVQGIELYEKLQAQSRLPRMVDGLSDELHELHNYVRQETDRSVLEVQKTRKENEEERNKLLSLLGALFLAPALLIAVYDLGFYGDCLKALPNVFYPLTILAAILTALIFYLTFVPSKTEPNVTKKELDAQDDLRKRRLPYAVGMYLALLCAPMIYGFCYCPAPIPVTIVEEKVSVLPIETVPIDSSRTVSPADILSPPPDSL